MDNNCDIFKVLKLERKETVHSAMIVAIASYNKECWNSFFDMLEEKKGHSSYSDYDQEEKVRFNIRALRKSINYLDNEHKWIDTGKNLNETVIKNDKKVVEYRGRADIWIGTNKTNTEEKYRLIIANRIDSYSQDHQLRRYYRYLTGNSRKYAGLFFLCVDGDKKDKDKAKESAQPFNAESKIDEPTKYAIITYHDIQDWLEIVIDETEDGDFKDAVKQYKKMIEDCLLK